MYQNIQVDGTVIQNLQHPDLRTNRVLLLAPYETKKILVDSLDPQTRVSVVLYDSSGGKEVTDSNISPLISYVGKTP